MNATRVAVVGASGRMGSEACRAVADAPDLSLVAEIDSSDPLERVVDAGTTVAVEFTTPATVIDNAVWLLEHGVHTVIGTSGIDADGLKQLEAATGDANCLVVPNFAIGAVLMMRLAEQAAAHLDHVEIIELHHDRKVDAPSGTAAATAERIAAARTAAIADRTAARSADGAAQVTIDVPGPAGHPARGLLHDDVPIHSVRLPGLVASQAVVFGAPGQTLTIRHDSIDRRSFMPGVLLAVRGVADLPAGLTVGLDALLA